MTDSRRPLGTRRLWAVAWRTALCAAIITSAVMLTIALLAKAAPCSTSRGTCTTRVATFSTAAVRTATASSQPRRR
jgi:hypothetical protein